jgi:penicillin-binding protein 1B
LAPPRSRPPARSVPRRRRRAWLRALLTLFTLAALLASGAAGYFYVHFSQIIDQRLREGMVRSSPRVFARPFQLKRGQAMTEAELVERLNDLGYAQRGRVELPGQFAVGRDGVALVARGGQWHGKVIRVVLASDASGAKGGRKRPAAGRVQSLVVVGGGEVDTIVVDPPMLSSLLAPGREKRRRVPLATIPERVRQAVLAIEDRRFYEHPGVDIVRTAGALVTNVRGDRPYLEGGSTLTQQLVKNSFLTREKTYTRKLQEQGLSVLLERRLAKDEILELYLNEVYLGQRGSFAIHGIAEAARLYFGKDVSNLSLAEAAMIAGLIQAPPYYSPFRSPERCVQRRNVVLRAMVEAGYISTDAAERATKVPLETVAKAVDTEAPYFVDLIGQTFAAHYPALAARAGNVEIYTTIDIHLQRLAQDAVREGLASVDALLARRKRQGRAQAAMLAVDPRTGDVLAFVGGRGYSQSQFNRVTHARRQPGSVFKPFVYLTAFEVATAEGRYDLTPASVFLDEPTTFSFGGREWTPRNYNGEYDGPVTLRRALAMSRNSATARLAETVGYDRIAALWNLVGTGTPPRPYPSIALGVFEATPWEIAEAYTLFLNDGELRPLRTILRLSADGREVAAPRLRPVRRIAAAETTYLVTNMLRSVINEGTGAGARRTGFTLDAAGKTGTTNDLRDAWFVGFTPELLTVVWVGFDDNRALGLSGSQAALPIWTSFMLRALAGHPDQAFQPPAEGVLFVEIDRDTGGIATPWCPRTFREAFLTGTEPTQTCGLHLF